MDLRSHEIEHIRRWNEELTQEVSLRFRTAEDERTKDFESFCGVLRDLAPKVWIVKEEEEGEEENLPALKVRKGWTYYAIPKGTELIPFLEILSMLDQEQITTPESTQELIKEVQWLAHFKIYVTSQCPFCPQVVRQIAPFPLINPFIQVSVIDGELFSEMIRQDKIQAAPTVILDDQFRWTGTLRMEEVLDVLVHRDPAHFGAKTLKNMLKQGEASRLSEIMLQRNQIFPAFLELVIHPEWSTRLGAMVVMEEVSQRNVALVREALQALWPRLEEVATPIKGDIIYLCGESGGREWIAPLEGLLAGPYGNELWDVTEEALEKLRASSQD
jgi:hypothetical protein